MKKLILVFVVLVSVFSFAQEKYEYVIVPKKFEFLDENEYNLNALTKSFFETERLTVFYDTDELPIEVANNRCAALYADAVESNKLFTTNITIQVRDCQNKIVAESFKGSSREKDFEIAYREAFRAALTTLKGQLNLTNKLNVSKATVQKVEEKKVEVETVSNVPSSINTNQLFALPIDNGYKLVDSVSNVIYIIYNSSEGNVFIAEKGEIHGVFQKKISGWYFDYYQDGKLISEKVNVKF